MSRQHLLPMPLVASARPSAVTRPAAPIVVDEELFERVVRSTSANTLRALAADKRVYEAWCHARGRDPFPSDDRLLADFLRAQGALGKKPATLSRYAASINRIQQLVGMPAPAGANVREELRAQGVERGTAQRQARGLRFKGEIGDPRAATAAGGVCVAHLMNACPETLDGVRDRALLSLAYDAGLRRSEVVALKCDDLTTLASGAGSLLIARSKTDKARRGVYVFVSARTVQAVAAWRALGGIRDGSLFRRVNRSRRKVGDADGNGRWEDVLSAGRNALAPASVTLIYKAMARRAYASGHLPHMDAAAFEAWLAGLSAHSTRVGVTQDLFAAGEDLSGIMQALRWKTAAMPVRYGAKLTVEANAAARVVGKL